MNPERDKEIMRASWKCYHEFPITGMCACIKCTYQGADINPDFNADPVSCLEVMMEREDWPKFLDTIGGAKIYSSLGKEVKREEYIIVGYITDRTGRLADLAYEWIKRT